MYVIFGGNMSEMWQAYFLEENSSQSALKRCTFLSYLLICFVSQIAINYLCEGEYNLKMNKDDLKKGFKEKLRELRKIINSRELIPGSPKDEFDSLNHQILSHLYKGADCDKITRIIDSELTVTYGLSIRTEDAEKIASEITQWWNLTDRIFN